MNTQNLNPKTLTQTANQESSSDTFAQSLLLWMASFPLFAIGLAMLGGTLNTIGYVLVMCAVICFLSPVAQLLVCLADKR